MELAESLVQHAAADAGIDLIQGGGGGDHSRQFGVVTVIQDLVKFFLRPWGGALCPQVIQDEEGVGAHLVEHLVIRDGAVRAEGSPQVVQQIRHHHEHRAFTRSEERRVGKEV